MAKAFQNTKDRTGSRDFAGRSEGRDRRRVRRQTISAKRAFLFGL